MIHLPSIKHHFSSQAWLDMILHISKHLRTLLSSERCFHHTFRSFWQSFSWTRSSSYQYLPAGSGQPRTPRQEFKWYFKITENCRPAKSLQELSFAKFIADNPMVVISTWLLATFFFSHSSILSHSHFVLVSYLEFYHLSPRLQKLSCVHSPALHTLTGITEKVSIFSTFHSLFYWSGDSLVLLFTEYRILSCLLLLSPVIIFRGEQHQDHTTLVSSQYSLF